MLNLRHAPYRRGLYGAALLNGGYGGDVCREVTMQVPVTICKALPGRALQALDDVTDAEYTVTEQRQLGSSLTSFLPGHTQTHRQTF